jgi:hypothetical protein
VVSRGEEEDNEVQGGERDLMVMTAASIASRGRSRGRLELGEGAGALGDRRGSRSAVGLGEPRA